MKILGIAAEYNPFHKGHGYHLERSMEISGADVSVAVMSGNFTQRGEPAVFDKWQRAETAVENGVDLVLELPFIYACNSAEFFAEGAVKILGGIGASFMSFGSESGDLEKLSDAAEFFLEETDEYRDMLRKGLKDGLPFAKARSLAAKTVMGTETGKILEGSNNILAIEYLKQIKLRKSGMTPLTVKREGSGHTDISADGDMPSAAALRERMRKQDVEDAVFPADMYGMIMETLMTRTAEELSEILSVSEGLENKMKSRFRYASDMESLVKELSSKRYAVSRIRRMLIQALMGLTKEKFDRARNHPYARVLAFSSKGAETLKEIKKKEIEIPVINNINKQVRPDDDIWGTLSFDVLASDIYNLAAGRDLYDGCDMIKTVPVRK